MDQIVFLEGERIILRPLEQTDLTKEYIQWLNDAEVCRFNSHATFPYTEEKMRVYYQSLQQNTQSAVVLAIIHKETGKHVGNISLQSIDWLSRAAEFAILLGNKDYWGKGIASEAALLLCDYGFIRLNLNRIHCGTSSENTGMQQLAARLKMTHEGTRRQAMYKNGKYVDILEYGVLRDEFLNG
jgi:ribosomal-protein-alanine N-acetyltransferase